MIFALLKSVKFWVILGAITAVLAFAKWAHGEVYEAGYNAAELKWRTAQQQAIDDALRDARTEWQASVEAAEENIRVETVIEERIRVVEKEVPKIVERVIQPECRDLGPDIQRMYNDAIRAANNISGGDAAPAAQPADEM